MSLLINLLISSFAFSCPHKFPTDFHRALSDKNTYTNSQRTVTLAIQCRSDMSDAKSLESLKLLGEVQELDPHIYFVDLKDNQLRILQTVQNHELIQIALVAKNPVAMQEGARTALELLKTSP